MYRQLLYTKLNRFYYILHVFVQGIDGTIVEFGTVIVYTCTESCWSQSDVIKAG